MVIVTGGCIPRLAKLRNTSKQLSALSLFVVERLSNTLRPSSHIAYTHRTPVFCSQRRNGS